MIHNAQKNPLRWYLFHNNCVLFPRHSFPNNHHIQAVPKIVQQNVIRQFSFTDHANTTIQCAELRHDFNLTDDWIAVSLRQALEVVSPEHYGALARAHAILLWDQNHQYCGRCGSSTEHTQNSFERLCKACQLYFYPRISPSVIILIHRGDELLMARGHHFPEGVYGLIAGFVEAGESLEEAAHREIQEEVGITVKNLNFFASQAWPFPDSLMIGFFAEYDAGDIVIEKRELDVAGWYHIDNMPGKPRTSISIASRLIEHFVNSRR